MNFFSILSFNNEFIKIKFHNLFYLGLLSFNYK